MSHTDPSPTPTAPQNGRGRVIKIAAIIAALVVILGAVAFLVARGQGGQTAATPVATTAAPSSESAPSSNPVTTSGPPATTQAAPPPPKGGCTTAEGLMHDPKRFKVDARSIDSRMITVGKDSDGNPGAPPPSESQTTAWFSGSPEVGADKGNTILTIHTYSPKNGANALGNKLYSDSGLKPGDVIRIVDGNGKQECYRYTGNRKVWVSSYDPASGVFHNLTGPPQLAIMICWDHNAKTNDWDSRIIFYAAKMAPGEA